MASKEEVKVKIDMVLSQIRPYLIEDGGDLVLVDLTDELVAKVELKGNCTSCSLNSMTFTNSIVDSILRAVPEIKSVQPINFTLIKPQL